MASRSRARPTARARARARAGARAHIDTMPSALRSSIDGAKSVRAARQNVRARRSPHLRAQVYQVASKDPPRTLRFLSAISGLFLILGGIVGIFTLNPLAIIISIYNVMFGILIVLTELKSWPIISTFQKRVDVYFHLLSVPRGKGAFYCFVGFLAFMATDWGLSAFCVLIVGIVGLLHLLMCKRCGAPGADAQQTQPIETAEDGIPAGGGNMPSTWSGLMQQVVADNPSVLAAGLGAAVSGGVSASASDGNGFGTAPLQAPPPAVPKAGELPTTSNMSG